MKFIHFNWRIYNALNIDLQKVGFRCPADYYYHYLEHGKSEGRPVKVYDKYPDFVPEVYKGMYMDLLQFNQWVEDCSGATMSIIRPAHTSQTWLFNSRLKPPFVPSMRTA